MNQQLLPGTEEAKQHVLDWLARIPAEQFTDVRFDRAPVPRAAEGGWLRYQAGPTTIVTFTFTDPDWRPEPDWYDEVGLSHLPRA